jgi:O-antigen/teichoic acid export membrane protein
VAGLIAAAPPLSALGLHFILNREIVDLPVERAIIMIRDRIITTLPFAVLFATAAVVVSFFTSSGGGARFALIAALVVSEVCAADVYLSLLSLRRPIAANIQLFFRSGLWVLPFLAASYNCHSLLTLNALLLFWQVGIFLSYILLFYCLRGVNWKMILLAPIDYTRVRDFRHVWPIYLGDIGSVGFTYADRYVVGGLLGLASTGIYMFFFQIVNSVQVLLTSTFVQPSLPNLVSAHNQGPAIWRSVVRRTLFHLIGATVPLFAVAYISIRLFSHLTGRQELSQYKAVAAIMCVAFFIRTVSDFTHYCLYSVKRDNELAFANILSLLVGILTSGILTAGFGLIGLSVGMCISSAAILALRIYLLCGRGSIR